MECKTECCKGESGGGNCAPQYGNCQYQGGNCQGSGHCSHYSEMGGEMKMLADEAWSCLMKEKMKKAFDEKMGKQMDAVAKLSAEHSIRFWEIKMGKKGEMMQEIEQFNKKLGEAMKM